MRTIGLQRPADSPRGDYATRCDYCGVRWLRSKLRRDASGLLACPDETGADMVTLSRANAAAARRPQPKPTDGGGAFHATADDSRHLLDLDTAPATIKSRAPAVGYSGVAPTLLSMRFSKWVDPGLGSVVVRRSSDDVAVQTIPAAEFERSGWTMSTTLGALVAGQYYVIVEATAFVDLNQEPFAGVLSKQDWRFTVT